MLEPRGADSSTSFEPETDVSARVLSVARNALLQGRIADAIEAADAARHDADLTEVVVKSGHWMAQEKPVDVNAALARWLAVKLPDYWKS